jgi:hypothetical protein
MRASLEQLQLELGIPKPVFESSYSTYGGLSTPCWLSHIWESCDSKGITIIPSIPDGILTTADPWKHPLRKGLKKRTTNDKFLMHLLTKLYHGETLFSLNICRMYLHATTLLDITTGDGLFITFNAWTSH